MYILRFGFSPPIPLCDGEPTDTVLFSVIWAHVDDTEQEDGCVTDAELPQFSPQDAHYACIVMQAQTFSETHFFAGLARYAQVLPPLVAHRFWFWADHNMHASPPTPVYVNYIARETDTLS